MLGYSALSEAPFSALAGGISPNVSVNVTGVQASGVVGSVVVQGPVSDSVTVASKDGTHLVLAGETTLGVKVLQLTRQAPER